MRYYNPDLGRWINRDPIGELAFFNQYLIILSLDERKSVILESRRPVYLFVSNAPIASVDKHGLASQTGCQSEGYIVPGTLFGDVTTYKCKEPLKGCTINRFLFSDLSGRCETWGYDVMSGGGGRFVTACYCASYKFKKCKYFCGDSGNDSGYYPVFKICRVRCGRSSVDCSIVRWFIVDGYESGSKSVCESRWEEELPDPPFYDQVPAE